MNHLLESPPDFTSIQRPEPKTFPEIDNCDSLRDLEKGGCRFIDRLFGSMLQCDLPFLEIAENLLAAPHYEVIKSLGTYEEKLQYIQDSIWADDSGNSGTQERPDSKLVMDLFCLVVDSHIGNLDSNYTYVMPESTASLIMVYFMSLPNPSDLHCRLAHYIMCNYNQVFFDSYEIEKDSFVFQFTEFIHNEPRSEFQGIFYVDIILGKWKPPHIQVFPLIGNIAELHRKKQLYHTLNYLIQNQDEVSYQANENDWIDEFERLYTHGPIDSPDHLKDFVSVFYEILRSGQASLINRTRERITGRLVESVDFLADPSFTTDYIRKYFIILWNTCLRGNYAKAMKYLFLTLDDPIHFFEQVDNLLDGCVLVSTTSDEQSTLPMMVDHEEWDEETFSTLPIFAHRISTYLWPTIPVPMDQILNENEFRFYFSQDDPDAPTDDLSTSINDFNESEETNVDEGTPINEIEIIVQSLLENSPQDNILPFFMFECYVQ